MSDRHRQLANVLARGENVTMVSPDEQTAERTVRGVMSELLILALEDRCPQCGVKPSLKRIDGEFLLECLCMERRGPRLLDVCEQWVEACEALRRLKDEREATAKRRTRRER